MVCHARKRREEPHTPFKGASKAWRCRRLCADRRRRMHRERAMVAAPRSRRAPTSCSRLSGDAVSGVQAHRSTIGRRRGSARGDRANGLISRATRGSVPLEEGCWSTCARVH